jgi:hypothetical protein
VTFSPEIDSDEKQSRVMENKNHSGGFSRVIGKRVSNDTGVVITHHGDGDDV